MAEELPRVADMEAQYPEEITAALQKMNIGWQQTMLRVKDPQASVQFYTENFGMALANVYKFDDFSLYFLCSLREGDPAPPEAGSDAAHEYVFNARHGQAFLELTHNHGTEKEDAPRPLKDHAGREQVYHNGNSDPRGFGHVAFNVDDVYARSKELEEKGCKFKKRPDEGRMKGLAFVLDPDGYWVELVRRDPSVTFASPYNLSQTMIRVKDPTKSVPFYRELFGMKLLSERNFGDFSLYFLRTPADEETSSKKMFDPALELTWNWGTEKEEGPAYHNGNDVEWKGEAAPRGFGHVGFLTDDLVETCKLLEQAGVKFKKKPEEGTMRQIAFAYDPDNYFVEIIQRNFSF